MEDITFGVDGIPRVIEWWLTNDVAGTVVRRSQENVVDLMHGPPHVAYAQVYHVDKEMTTGKVDHPMVRMGWEDMRWSKKRFRDAYAALSRGLEEGSTESWGARFEIRVSGKKVFEAAALKDIYGRVYSNVLNSPGDYLFALPTLQVCRYKAANLWLVMDGTRRVDASDEQDSPEAAEGFMKLLASLFRGLYQGPYYSFYRKWAYGSVNSNNDHSLGLGKSICKYNRVYFSPRKVYWMRARATIQGSDDPRETLVTLGELIGPAELEVLRGIHLSDLPSITPVILAEVLMEMLKTDMIAVFSRYQESGSIQSWSLEEVRHAIPRKLRVENHISNRRMLKTWRGLFEYLFPEASSSQGTERTPRLWARIKHRIAFFCIRDLICIHKDQLAPGTYDAFYDHLWHCFQEMDCAPRPYIRYVFAYVSEGAFYIDLRDT